MLALGCCSIDCGKHHSGINLTYKKLPPTKTINGNRAVSKAVGKDEKSVLNENVTAESLHLTLSQIFFNSVNEKINPKTQHFSKCFVVLYHKIFILTLNFLYSHFPGNKDYHKVICKSNKLPPKLRKESREMKNMIRLHVNAEQFSHVSFILYHKKLYKH